MTTNYTVNLEEPESGEMKSWTGEADDEGHAQDLAREAIDPDDTLVVIDIFQEEG